jgi:hypothetical protein
MAEDKVPLWKAAIAGSILGTLFPEWAMKIQNQWKEQVFQDKVRKLEEKLAKAKPKDKPKMEREILLFKAKHWWLRKPFKEQWAMEKGAKRLGIKLDDYLIEEYTKFTTSQNTR